MKDEYAGYPLGALGVPLFSSGWRPKEAIERAARMKTDEVDQAAKGLTAARKSYGLTTTDAAFVLGIAGQTLRNHEAGKVKLELIQAVHARLVVEMEGAK